MPELTASSHDTPFTPADRTLADNVDKTLKAFLAAMTAWETACKKYPKDYGQAADALTVIVSVRALLCDLSVKVLEAKQ